MINGMDRFIIGMRVYMTANDGIEKELPQMGATGTIVAKEGDINAVAVEWDEPFGGGHDCGGICEHHCGRWYFEESDPATFDGIDIIEPIYEDEKIQETEYLSDFIESFWKENA